jgi:hypothetical protein
VAGMLERLTYLLGICVAVIGWSITQLSASLSADQVVGYSIESKDIGNSLVAEMVHLENLSRTLAPQRILVSAVSTTPKNSRGIPCVPLLEENPQIITPRLVTQVPSDASGRKGFLSIGAEFLPPGAPLDLYIEHPAGCNVIPMIDIRDSDKTRTRLLPLGLQSYMYKNQFGALLALVLVFGFVFAISFSLSILIATRKPQ